MKVKRNGKAAALTPEQFDKLVTAAPSARYASLWTLQRLTASRIGEALALTWGDVAGGKVTFRRSTTKTKTTRQVPQSLKLKQALASYRQQWVVTAFCPI